MMSSALCTHVVSKQNLFVKSGRPPCRHPGQNPGQSAPRQHPGFPGAARDHRRHAPGRNQPPAAELLHAVRPKIRD